MEVSTICPVYNGEKYLLDALESIDRQTVKPAQLVIIDDGSTDMTRHIVESFETTIPVTYHHQENQGLATARNRGISMAQHALIAFIDADDTWHPQKLELQLEEFQKHPDTDIVSSAIEQFISPEIPVQDHDNYTFHRGPVQSLLMGTSLIRREVFQRVGEFNADFRVAQDMDWVSRAISKGVSVTEYPQPLYARRLHPGNLGRGRLEESYRNRFRILQQKIRRESSSGKHGS